MQDPESQVGEEDREWIVVASFGTEPEADMAKSALESADIEVLLQADSAGGQRPHLAWASGGYKLLVSESDLEAARAVLTVPETANPQ